MQNVPAFAGMITSLCAILFNFILFGLPGLVGGSISIYGLVKANRLAASGVTAGNGRGVRDRRHHRRLRRRLPLGSVLLHGDLASALSDVLRRGQR